MTGFYKEMQGIATELLGEFNQGSIEYVEIKPGNGPVDNPGPSVPVPHPVNGAARGVQRRYVDNSSIVQSDLQVTIDANAGFVPQMNGFVRGDGVQYKIVGVKQVPPFGVPVAYVVIFRK